MLQCQSSFLLAPRFPHTTLLMPHSPPSGATPPRLQEVHGSGDIPPDYADAACPDWVEAGRWLARQRELYRLQKLLLLRVRLIKQLLGGWSCCCCCGGRGLGRSVGAAAAGGFERARSAEESCSTGQAVRCGGRPRVALNQSPCVRSPLSLRCCCCCCC